MNSKKLFLLSLFSFCFLSINVFPGFAQGTVQTTLCKCDINKNGVVDITDFGLFKSDFGTNNSRSDFLVNDDPTKTIVDISDYGIFVGNFGKTCPSNTATPTPTATPTKLPSPTPSTSTAPRTSPIPASSYIWLSPDEIKKLPMSGQGWENVKNAANSSWGSANLGENNSNHDVNTLAGALVYVRTGDSAMREKTIKGLESAMQSPLTRALELSRGLQAYVIAADIIDYREQPFKDWVRKMLNEKVSPHVQGIACNQQSRPISETKAMCDASGGVVCTALNSANNWGGHARASTIAAALYLKDTQLLQKVTDAHKAFIGESVPNYLTCESTNWHADSTNRYGINKAGTKISNVDVSGVLPEDWRRASGFKWPPDQTGYMWEGIQGAIVSAVMLHRAGLVDYSSQNGAMDRALDILINRVKYLPEGDDAFIPWLHNKYGTIKFPTTNATNGKGIGWTSWTHQP